MQTNPDIAPLPVRNKLRRYIKDDDIPNTVFWGISLRRLTGALREGGAISGFGCIFPELFVTTYYNNDFTTYKITVQNL
jgi:hypothetical protein